MFMGVRSAVVTAAAGGGLGFMRWRLASKSAEGAEWPAAAAAGTSPRHDYVSVVHGILYADWGVPVEVPVSVIYAAGCDEAVGRFAMVPVTGARVSVFGGVSDKYVQGSEVTLEARALNGYTFTGWFLDAAGAGTAVSLSASMRVTVATGVSYYARFAKDTNAVYRWEGSEQPKRLTWRGKRFAAAVPVNLSAATVQADGYPVTLRVYAASSPDAPGGNCVAELAVPGCAGVRLPRARPERFVELEVSARVDVTCVVAATSMEGLRG